VRSSVNRIGEQPWREMLGLQTRRRSSTYRLACGRELISVTRVYTRSTRDHRPMLGDYASSCGSWSLYCATGNIPMALSEAIIATYMTIHMARSPGSHSERIASPCQELQEGAEILRVWLSGNERPRHDRDRTHSQAARLELKAQVGVVLLVGIGGTAEWAKSSTLLSCGAAFGTVL
jgi:hypothetical protein